MAEGINQYHGDKILHLGACYAATRTVLWGMENMPRYTERIDDEGLSKKLTDLSLKLSESSISSKIAFSVGLLTVTGLGWELYQGKINYLDMASNTIGSGIGAFQEYRNEKKEVEEATTEQVDEILENDRPVKTP